MHSVLQKHQQVPGVSSGCWLILVAGGKLTVTGFEVVSSKLLEIIVMDDVDTSRPSHLMSVASTVTSSLERCYSVGCCDAKQDGKGEKS